MRVISRKRRVLMSHGRNSFSKIQQRSAIATWNLRRLGQGNWGETSWLKLHMLTRVCAKRGWRASLLSDCYLEGSGTFVFGVWVVLGWWFSMAGVRFCWTQGWPTCGQRAANDATITLMAVLWLWWFCVPVVVLAVRVLCLVSVYCPVSGAVFDDERRVMFDSISAILGVLPERSIWIIGGGEDFNAQIGFRGVGEESALGIHAHGRCTRSGRSDDGMGTRRGTSFLVVLFSPGL